MKLSRHTLEICLISFSSLEEPKLLDYDNYEE